MLLALLHPDNQSISSRDERKQLLTRAHAQADKSKNRITILILLVLLLKGSQLPHITVIMQSNMLNIFISQSLFVKKRTEGKVHSEYQNSFYLDCDVHISVGKYLRIVIAVAFSIIDIILK